MMQHAFEIAQRLQQNMESVMLGKSESIRNIVLTLLAGEHLLLEDVPGVGKTLAAKALAGSLKSSFHRVQFTPDLLPSDITGSSIFRNDTAEFEFVPGPVFANVVLADEINRAPPRTQSALLEAMSDQQVSVDGKTYPLPSPFIVIATQNPFEHHGTYELPESQMDRFLMRTSVGYPAAEMEREVLHSHRQGEPVDSIQSVVEIADVLQAQASVRTVKFDVSLEDYLLQIVQRTRTDSAFAVGVSTRAAISFYRGCQARAVTENRDYVTPDDIKTLAIPVLAHRVLLDDYLGKDRRRAAEATLADVVASIAVPV
ncbi:ATPase RavA [Stieleria bergensis]|uniref:ATPase RavA n=2 Tax=Stieleria bergensis TaxID=2528025 RepID=A0A517SSL9_9BACT|nr:ATPase RavA [Planctomycetes bacterium SV_7m_r]